MTHTIQEWARALAAAPGDRTVRGAFTDWAAEQGLRVWDVGTRVHIVLFGSSGVWVPVTERFLAAGADRVAVAGDRGVSFYPCWALFSDGAAASALAEEFNRINFTWTAGAALYEHP